jgi:hypothetical protein
VATPARAHGRVTASAVEGRQCFVRRWAPLLVSAVTALLVLGPALGRGVALTYDLAWSPDPRWTPFTLGQGTPAPRAVPSDAVGVALGHLLGAGAAQALVLVAILVLAGAGTARLAARAAPGSPAAPLAAAVAGVWNPFVLERLVVGQWTVLLGYAVVPHLLLSAHRARTEARATPLLGAGVAACGVGGGNTLVLAVLAVLPVLALPRPRWWPIGVTLLAAAGSGAVWALPALTAGIRSGVGGADAFAPRSDTPFGAVASLVSGGAFWNPASHPAERQVWPLATLATVLALASIVAMAERARRRGLTTLLAPALVGTVLAVAAVVDPAGAWSWLVATVPGAGLLRDAQKLVAPLVVVAAAGAGLLVAGTARRGAAGPALALLLAALPVVLLPSLAWGVHGRVSATEVPADLRSAATLLSGSGKGAVGLLPWSQYRRYAWNEDRVSLTLAPRMVDRLVLFDDRLPLADRRVPGEDPVAAAVTAAIDGGTDPVDALRSVGVRYVLVERRAGRAGPGAEAAVPAGALVLADGPNALVLDLGPSGDASPVPPVPLVGWVVTTLAWVAAAALAGHAGWERLGRARRGRPYRLVQSRP